MSSAAPDKHSVVVVGGGLAGLYAAKLLQQHFPDVIVLEATEQPGGRVKQASVKNLLLAVLLDFPEQHGCYQVHGIAPWPIEAGPQFVHGANSFLKVRNLFAIGKCLHLVLYRISACMQTMLDEMHCGIKEYDWPDWWYFGKKRQFLKAPEQAGGKLFSIQLYTKTKSIIISWRWSLHYHTRSIRVVTCTTVLCT